MNVRASAGSGIVTIDDWALPAAVQSHNVWALHRIGGSGGNAMTDFGSGSGSGETPAPIPVQQQVEWKMLASEGDLMLAQSPHEFAVYTSSANYGRWPATHDGYNLALQMYEARRQSLAHGVAYAATGYQDPSRLGLPTDPVMKSKTYASPMSYVGSTRRIVSWASGVQKRATALAVLVWTAAVFAMLLIWTFLIFWYFVVFFLFGIFAFPYRLMRRSQRKNLHVQQTALATQQAMLQQMAFQQQQMMQAQVQAQQYPVPPQSAIPPSAPPPLPPAPS